MNIPFKDLRRIGWAYLMFESLKIGISFLAQPHLWCKCYDLLLHYALLHLLSVLDDFGGARMPYLCTPMCMNNGELLRFYLELSLWIFSIAFLLCGDI